MKFGDLSVSLEYGTLPHGISSTSRLDKSDNLLSTPGKVTEKFSGILHSFISMLKERKAARESVSGTGDMGRERRFGGQKLKKYAKSLLIVLVVGIGIVGLGRLLFKTGNSVDSGGSPEVKAAKATVAVNKEFSFPLNGADGEKVSDVKFMIENAELRDEIIVNGQRATSIKGRQFLILTIKISNEYKSAIQIDTRDYVRLAVNGVDEWLAPDIHNDPVEVQAISTKYTRLGFALNEADKDIQVRIGEINGDKETVPLEF